MLPRINIDTDPENMLSADNPARLMHQQLKQQFAMHDMIVVGAVSTNSIFTPEHLGHLTELSNFIESLDGVITKDLLSLNVVDNIKQAEQGAIRFEYLMKSAPQTQAESDEIQRSVNALPLLHNTLVAESNQAVAIYVPLEAKSMSFAIAEQIRAFIPSMDSTLSFHITGLPVAEDQFGVEMFIQMGIAAPLAGLAIFVLLWYFFRNFTLIIAPMVVAMSTVIIVMGSLIGMGFTVHIMSSMIAIFLMPIAVVDSVHILSEFADRFTKDKTPTEVVTQVMEHLFTPMLFTSITSAVGFFSLMLTPIPPVQVFGAFIGSGILLAFVLTIFFLPVYLSRLTPEQAEKIHQAVLKSEKAGKLSGVLLGLGKFSIAKTKPILVVFSILLIVSFVGISKIEINDNPVNWFKADHEIRVADKVLNQHFAGTYDAWLAFSANNTAMKAADKTLVNMVELAKPQVNMESVVRYIEQQQNQDKAVISTELLVLLDDLSFTETGESLLVIEKLYLLVEQTLADAKLFTQPEVLNWLVDFQTAIVATDLVGKVNGLPDVVRTVNRELNSGQEKDFVIPTSANGVAQTLLQYQSSHRPQDLWHFVSQDYQQGLLWLQLNSGDNQDTSNVVKWVEQYMQAHPFPVEVNVNWGGKSYLNTVWQDAMVSGMADSLISSFVVVFLMMVLLFRSIKYGVLAMLPLTFTISLIYGMIGWFGKAYDMPIAVLSALTLGLSIDFAIHFLQRLRELEKEMSGMLPALSAMFEEPARAIARNAIIIAIGFTPLLLSPLVPYITVGTFLASIMAISALVTLILLPALLTVFQPKNSSEH